MCSPHFVLHHQWFAYSSSPHVPAALSCPFTEQRQLPYHFFVLKVTMPLSERERSDGFFYSTDICVRRLYRKPIKESLKLVFIKEQDKMCWQIACFEIGKRSLKLIRTSLMCNGVAGKQTYFGEPADVLFTTGRFLQKEVVAYGDCYLGEKSIWYFGRKQYIW
jgi:hypothetical protein